MQEMPEEEALLVTPLHIYDCQRCREVAEHPVLPQCGHLHWYEFI